ncbi:MAG: DUF4229 domain-containing protein [Actinobacteria bacterium]|nr:DUF4229 domain-containing protein [Actinomycetota bacterium]
MDEEAAAEAEHVEPIAVDESTSQSKRFGLLRYTAIRLVLFIAVTAVLWLVGIRANLFFLLALGLVISGFISLFALNRTRDDASASVSGAFSRINRRIEQSATAEDIEPDPPPTE